MEIWSGLDFQEWDQNYKDKGIGEFKLIRKTEFNRLKI